MKTTLLERIGRREMWELVEGAIARGWAARAGRALQTRDGVLHRVFNGEWQAAGTTGTRGLNLNWGDMRVGDVMRRPLNKWVSTRTAACQFVRNHEPTWKFHVRRLPHEVLVTRVK